MNKNEIIFFIVLISQNLAFNFAHPVTPTLITELALPSYTFGLAFGFMALSSFMFSKFWGYISEMKQEKNIFFFGCVLYGLCQLMFLHSKTVFDILFARFLGGIFISAINVSSLVYIIKISESYKKARNISLFTGLTSVMTAFGYLFGGFIGNSHLEYAFYLQFTTLVFCGLIFYLFGIKTNENRRLEQHKIIRSFNVFNNYMQVENHKIVNILLVIVFLTIFGQTIFEQTFNFYIKDIFNILPARMGIIKSITGIIIIIANLTIGNYILKSKNIHRRTSIVLILCSCFAVVTILFSNETVFLLGNYLFMSLNAVQLVLIQSIYVDQTSDNAIGTYNCLKSLGWVFGGFVAGFAYDAYCDLPFIVVAILFLMSTLFFGKVTKLIK